jgi:hypothetical protein
MSKETTLNIEAFERDPLDGEIDINNLPPAPWTRSALGEKLFADLARAAGVGIIPMTQRDPSLDPRSFGLSRAKRIIKNRKLTGEEAASCLKAGEELQRAIDLGLPPIKGKPRNPKAPPLRPARTRFQERGPKPSTWS